MLKNYFIFLMFYFLSGINAFKNDPMEGQQDGSVGKAPAAKADNPHSISRS